MQIQRVQTVRPSVPMAASAAPAPAVPASSPAHASATTFAGVQDAVEGAAPPAFDFPGFATGDKFKIAKGSKMNNWGIGGDARIDELTDTSAKFWIKGGKFGFSREAKVEITQTSPTTAHLHSDKKGRTFDIDLKILESTRGRARFVPDGFPNDIAVLETLEDGKRLRLDFKDVQDGDNYRLLLEKR